MVGLPSKSPIYHTTSDPEVKEDEDDLEPELEAIYEPPPISRVGVKKQSLTTPSESDEPQYSGQSLYGRAPSQCSSISATQSFDLRMYGRLPKGSVALPPASAGTLKKTEETRFVNLRVLARKFKVLEKY